MLSFIFDTETTGACTNKDPADPKHDEIMQFYGGLYEHDPDKGYIIEDENNDLTLSLKPIVSLNFIVQCDKEPHRQAVAVHGISKERSTQVGIDPGNLAHILDDMIDIADRLVCHNVTFDTRMVKRLFWLHDIDPLIVDSKPSYCTMATLKPVMRMLPKVYGDWKNPKLIEAYRYIFNREFENAHDASADASACAAIYFALLHLERQKA